MDWNDVRYFLEAYRRRSLAKAARALRCDHATVSRRLAALERALGSKLFVRTPDGLVPTPAAEALLPAAEDAERALRRVERRGSAHDRRPEGVVRLTLPEPFAAPVVAGLARLRARHPGLVVDVLVENRMLDLARGEADLAFRFGPTTQPEIVSKKLCDLPGAMYASEAYLARHGAPSPPTDLRGHEIVDYADNLAAVPGARWLAAHRAGATVAFRGSSLLSLLDAAAAGIGLTVVPCGLADRQPALRRLSPKPLCHGSLFVAVHPDLAALARVRAVMRFLESLVRAKPAPFVGA